MNIPTAEEYGIMWEYRSMEVLGTPEQGKPEHSLAQFFKEFAKLHVKEALKAAHRNFQAPEEDLEFTLNSYPEDLIK